MSTKKLPQLTRDQYDAACAEVTRGRTRAVVRACKRLFHAAAVPATDDQIEGWILAPETMPPHIRDLTKPFADVLISMVEGKIAERFHAIASTGGATKAMLHATTPVPLAPAYPTRARRDDPSCVPVRGGTFYLMGPAAQLFKRVMKDAHLTRQDLLAAIVEGAVYHVMSSRSGATAVTLLGTLDAMNGGYPYVDPFIAAARDVLAVVMPRDNRMAGVLVETVAGIIQTSMAVQLTVHERKQFVRRRARPSAKTDRSARRVGIAADAAVQAGVLP